MHKLLFLLAAPLLAAPPLLVVSVDGLDNRYLEQADQLGLRIPNLRRITRQGSWSKGIIGIVPTVTWPSHTTLITGAEAYEHGILSNRKPRSEGGDYYWSAKLLQRPTLLDLAAKRGLRTATVTWPVTVDAPSNFNLPEYFVKRRGGAMDTASICSKATPVDLCGRIARRYPSFRQEWMDDRTRSMAVRYLLEAEHPDLTLVHLVDLDSEEHDDAPFSTEAKAVLEYTDELIGQMMAALPKGGRVVLTSDHGFEEVKQEFNPLFAAKEAGIEGVQPMGGIVVARTDSAAQWLRGRKEIGVGREIPKEEVLRYAPKLSDAAAVFEAAPNVWLGFGSASLTEKPREIGNHGHWPLRYRSVYAAWGPGIPAARLPEASIKTIYGRLVMLLGLE